MSDMAAFKAANPGCCFEDFVRWHSPGDWLGGDNGGGAGAGAPGRLSQRMAAAGGAWRRLWAAARAAPAARQRPLMDARAAGERALHYLETLPPAALLDQLVAVAVSEAAALLGACGGARLAPAARALGTFRAAAAAALRRGGGGLAHALGAGAGALAWDDGSGGEGGFTDEGLELLLAEFHYAEQVVVAAESLRRRLPGQPALCARALAALVDGAPPPLAAEQPQQQPQRQHRQSRPHAAAAGGSGARRASRQRERPGPLTGVAFMPVAELSAPERAAVAGWLARAASSAGSSSGGGGEDDEPAAGLGEPAYREWVLLCGAASSGTSGGAPGRSRRAHSGGGGAAAAAVPATGAGAAAAGAAGAAAAPLPPSRMYAQEADGEMRLAFALVSQPGL